MFSRTGQLVMCLLIPQIQKKTVAGAKEKSFSRRLALKDEMNR
jgi:hypothetical protein